MALYVNTNVSAINAQRQLMNSGSSLDTSFKRLSSGLRINSAADDAAGLQISDRLTSQISGLEQGIRNANDGISLAQTAEGAMDEITSIFQRVRTLSQQAANGSLTDDDRQALYEEVHQLFGEVNRIATSTTFGGQNLLDGGYEASFQVGADALQTISFSMKNVGNTANSLSAFGGFTVSGIAQIVSDVVGYAMSDKLIGLSLIGDTTVGQDYYDFSSIGYSGVGVGDTITNIDNAQAMFAAMDAFIAVIDKKRAELGAAQNRFQSTIRNQANISENLSAARSRIRDADFAAETASLTKAQILQQASNTILSQANQRPQAALSLLG